MWWDCQFNIAFEDPPFLSCDCTFPLSISTGWNILQWFQLIIWARCIPHLWSWALGRCLLRSTPWWIKNAYVAIIVTVAIVQLQCDQRRTRNHSETVWPSRPYEKKINVLVDSGETQHPTQSLAMHVVAQCDPNERRKKSRLVFKWTETFVQF